MDGLADAKQRTAGEQKIDDFLGVDRIVSELDRRLLP